MIFRFNALEGFNFTVHTNTNCTLKCSYCYENHKTTSISEDKKFWDSTIYKDEKRTYNFINNDSKECVIDVEKVKSFIDQILEFKFTDFYKEFVDKTFGGSDKNKILIMDFIGGDSLQYPELLDEICTYLYRRLLEKDHPWKYTWTLSISSNGVTLLNPAARAFCTKWKDKLSLGLSIDGCPELHDLNRWCFADNEDGTHKGSFSYIRKIWPWYEKTFPDDSLRTKWTLAPNSYLYLLKSIKFLHEDLKMKYIMFNRVMENHIIDTPEQVWELIQEFERCIQYLKLHHLDLFCDTFGWNNTHTQSKAELLEGDETWTRCGFGRMPALSLDGNVYPCFRMVPGSNNLKDSAHYRQGTYKNLLENEETLRQLNINSRAINMNLEEKCKECLIFSICPHCAADCVDANGSTLTKTSSVCNFTRLQVFFARKYWAEIKKAYPSLYKNRKIDWTYQDQEDLLRLVLQDIVNIKEKENNNDNNC